MNILLVSNQHLNNGVGNPIIYRMKDSLSQNIEIECIEFFPFFNSFSTLISLRKKSKQFDIVHVHFGGIYALFVWISLTLVKCKKIITFHGTDIHAKALKSTTDYREKVKIYLNQKSSFLCIILYDKCGFVAKEMANYVPLCLNKLLIKKLFIQQLGVDYSKFIIRDKTTSQDYLGLEHKNYVLFSNVSNTDIKRIDIAEGIVNNLGNKYALLVMSGIKSEDVPSYINASDFILLTSDEEGSPNIIREALALNKPVFSVNVGDVAQQLSNLNNSAIISRNQIDAAKQIKEVLKIPYTDNTRETRRYALDSMLLNDELIDLYKKELTK